MSRALPNLEIDQLRSFVAVAESGGFTAAAARVARTQSAVSMQVKRLEETLGRRVLERSSRAVALTPEGRLLLDYARRMLALNDESVRRIASPPLAGRVRLGITEYFVPNDLARILARFAAAHPGVSLEVRMGLSRDLREDLRAGRLDAAFVRAEGPGAAGDILWREAQCWVAADAWEEDRAVPLPLVALPAPCVLRKFALEAGGRRRAGVRVAYTGSSMASVQAAVVAGLGVSIVARSSVLEGMRVLQGRAWPDPGALEVTALAGKGAAPEVLAALGTVARQELGGL